MVASKPRRSSRASFRVILAGFCVCLSLAAAHAADIRSARSGNWSDGKTWEGGKVPAEGTVVITQGTRVTYDVESDKPIREIQVSGVLAFARDRNTSLTVGLIRVTPAKDSGATGVEDVDRHGPAHGAPGDAHGHGHEAAATDPTDGPALEVGTPGDPIPVPYTARIRLHYFEGNDKDKLPAIVCRPGGRMDFHGAPMSRTWVKLDSTTKPGESTVTLMETPTGWRVGDLVAVTGSDRRTEKHSLVSSTERRIIKEMQGGKLVLDKPLDYPHRGEGKMRSEVANLTRTVIIESADASSATTRGHTMYHHGALGSISYTQLNALGKETVLGRYPIHFHLASDTMRGSSVVGAAVIDSGNRWVTVHGTQYMVVRDCVGVNSIGHGYFLEDGTEMYTIFDRNLGVRAAEGKKMKGQALPFDPNDGAGFWWANGGNTFIRNVVCENAEYGYRYESQGSRYFSAEMMIRQPDGSEKKVDIRTIPHYRFEANESHSEGLYAFVFADTAGVGPDAKHPHVLRNLVMWETHYGLRAQIPTMLIEGLHIQNVAYGVYRPWYDNHVYRNIYMNKVGTEPFNRGQDDDSAQAGSITVDGLTFANLTYGGAGMPLIQMSDNNLSGKAESHFRNVKVEGNYSDKRWPLVNRGGGSVVPSKTEKGVPVYLHDWFGPGKHAKVVCTSAKDLPSDRSAYKSDPKITGKESLVTEVSEVEFPQLLNPVDDQPPATIITFPARGHVAKITDGKLTIRGTTTDNTATKRVVVNGVEAKDVDFNFHQWEVTLTNVKPGTVTIEAYAEDAAGNKELTPHKVIVTAK